MEAGVSCLQTRNGGHRKASVSRSPIASELVPPPLGLLFLFSVD